MKQSQRTRSGVNANPNHSVVTGICGVCPAGCGDEVYVISPRGKVPFRAHVTENIACDTVEVNVGGGGALGPTAWRAPNANTLTDFYNRDPILGFPVFKALLCDVVKRGEKQMTSTATGTRRNQFSHHWL